MPPAAARANGRFRRRPAGAGGRTCALSVREIRSPDTAIAAPSSDPTSGTARQRPRRPCGTPAASRGVPLAEDQVDRNPGLARGFDDSRARWTLAVEHLPDVLAAATCGSSKFGGRQAWLEPGPKPDSIVSRHFTSGWLTLKFQLHVSS